MPILDFNISWMTYNCFLAFLAVAFGFIFLQVKHWLVRAFFGLLWLLFLPNTIYIFTDLEHLIFQWHFFRMPLLLVFITQYILLEIVGISTFLLAFLPFEKSMRKFLVFKRYKTQMLIAFNFFIAFGMVLGRVERINSWEVFTSPLKVIASAITVFSSLDLLGLTLLFGLLCNFLYFLFRDWLLAHENTIVGLTNPKG